MTMHIDQFNTTCYVPHQHRCDAERVDQLVRGRFAQDLGEHLGPGLTRQPAIVRIKLLPMRVILEASDLNEDALSIKWRREFSKTLFTALAYPPGIGPFEVYRAESIAGFVAAAIRDVLDGSAPNNWQFAEFESFFRLGSTQAALALICEWPQHCLGVLLSLADQGILSRLSSRFDDGSLDRIFNTLATASEPGTKAISVDELIAAARLALERPPERVMLLRTRSYALLLFVEACRASQPISSPRALFHTLLALSVLLNEEVFWPGVPQDEPQSVRLPSNVIDVLQSIAIAIASNLDQDSLWTGRSQGEPHATSLRSGLATILQSIGAALHKQVQATITFDTRLSTHANLAGIGQRSLSAKGADGISTQLVELDRLLQSLRAELKVPMPLAKPLEARWISGEWCGLFFLASTLERLGWIAAWRELSEFQAGGIGCLVIGLVLAIQGKFNPTVPSIDAVSTLFAGYLNDPDLSNARRVFEEYPREIRLRVLQAALLHSDAVSLAQSWESTFEHLAEVLLQAFASRIRGFRQATRQGIVRAFVARAGRIRIEPDRLIIFPAPSPFNVVLHVSGIDSPVVSSLFSNGRRVEFELGDL